MMLTGKRPSEREGAKDRIVQDLTDVGRKRRLNVEFDESLFLRAKQRAVSEDRSMSDITRELWADYLNRELNK